MTNRPLHQPTRRRLLRLAAGWLAGSVIASGRAQTISPRVVTLFQGATDSAVALGVTPVAVVDSWSEKPTYKYLRQALQGVPHVGLETQPSLEHIALLQPDLIVVSRFRHQRIAPLLQQIAPLVMLDNVFEFKQTLSVTAAALHRQAQAEVCLQQWQQRVANLRSQLQRRFAGHWPPTVSVLDIREDHIRSYLPGSFPGWVLSELGFGWNTTAQTTQGVSIKLSGKESLPIVNADIFFVFLRSESAGVQRNYHSLLQHPLWLQLRAPQQQQVWLVNGVVWSLSGGILGANLMLDDIERQVIPGTTA
uniref:ABC transporter substrate-binding protein n=1 Tax=Sodalis glossinidius TaxID=63612 RepID=UPI000054C96D|nr:iron-siderophore ABC transporter substrate-binding protein [Sodalis glossinidius]CAI59310.1 CbrA protein [Sodalis glossinidius]